jgi:hypothetical protein
MEVVPTIDETAELWCHGYHRNPQGVRFIWSRDVGGDSPLEILLAACEHTGEDPLLLVTEALR